MKSRRDAKKSQTDGEQIHRLSDEMRGIRKQRHNPFVKEGRPDADAYIAFISEFNAFVNHRPKPFRRIIDRSMSL